MPTPHILSAEYSIANAVLVPAEELTPESEAKPPKVEVSLDEEALTAEFTPFLKGFSNKQTFLNIQSLIQQMIFGSRTQATTSFL